MNKTTSNPFLKLAACAGCLWLLSVSSVPADTVRLAGGREIRGVPANKTGDPLVLQTVSGVVRIPRSQIVRIQPDSEAVNQLLLAEFQVRCGNALEAELHAGAALERGANRETMRDFCLRQEFFLQKALTGAQENKARTAWVALVRTIGGFQPPGEPRGPDDFTPPAWGSNPDNAPEEKTHAKAQADDAGAGADITDKEGLADTEFCLAMARVFAAVGEGAFALELLDRLDTPTFKEKARNETFIRPLMIEQVRRILSGYDFHRASALIQRMEAVELGVGDPSRILLALRWAAFERNRSRYDEALAVLEERLRPLSPSLAQERMGATLTEGLTQLSERGRFAEAVELLRKWGGKIREVNVRDREAELYREWGMFLLGQNEPARAREVFEKHYYLKPAPEGKKRLLDLCEFRERFTALRRTELAFAFELGQWAAENDLLEESLLAFERAAEHESLKDAAARQMEAARERIALAYLEECVSLYEKGDARGAMRKIDAFRDAVRDAETEERFRKLYQLCARELQRRSSLRTVQADTLLQDARRLLALRDYETVLRDLDLIQRQYADTPAAQESQSLARLVELRMGLDQLEGPSAAPVPPPIPARVEPRAEREIREILKALNIAGAEFDILTLSETAPDESTGQREE